MYLCKFISKVYNLKSTLNIFSKKKGYNIVFNKKKINKNIKKKSLNYYYKNITNNNNYIYTNKVFNINIKTIISYIFNYPINIIKKNLYNNLFIQKLNYLTQNASIFSKNIHFNLKEILYV